MTLIIAERPQAAIIGSSPTRAANAIYDQGGSFWLDKEPEKVSRATMKYRMLEAGM